MLTELCKELNNWFEQKDKYGEYSNRIFDTFTIENGTLTIDDAKDGQYFCIWDSTFNDGVHKYPATDLIDETFTGAVWLMAIPPRVVELDKEYDAWKEKNKDVLESPYQSESFGGYSYSKATSTGSSGSSVAGGVWDSPFAHELSHWRKA